jgi:tartrate dehydratase beta subunit/fumarate hydratase class I family protein
MDRSRTFLLGLTVYGVTTVARLGPALVSTTSPVTWLTVGLAALVLLVGLGGLLRDRTVAVAEERVLFVYLVGGAALLSTAALAASLLGG